MGAGRGLFGTVTEATADHYTIKTEAGESYTIHFSANTRIMKQPAGGRGPNGGGGAGGKGGQPVGAKALAAAEAMAATRPRQSSLPTLRSATRLWLEAISMRRQNRSAR